MNSKIGKRNRGRDTDRFSSESEIEAGRSKNMRWKNMTYYISQNK